jgi:hypothetical protein
VRAKGVSQGNHATLLPGALSDPGLAGLGRIVPFTFTTIHQTQDDESASVCLLVVDMVPQGSAALMKTRSICRMSYMMFRRAAKPQRWSWISPMGGASDTHH